jgi:nucleotide-binding universal stress UspA family protein
MASESVVVGLDGSDGSLHALRVAADQARLQTAPLEVVCAWHPSMVGSMPAFGVGTPVAETLDELRSAIDETLMAEGLGPDSGIDVTVSVVTEHAAEALIDASQRAALVVVGTRGRGNFAGLVLGSVSQKVLSHADCPVMVVPTKEP